MTPERFERMREVFDAARELTGAEREAMLAQSCGDDHELRTMVERLLRQEERESAVIDTTPFAGPIRSVLTAGAAPEQVGSFRILRLIGRGGMGEVYEARQDHPRRSVAIKLLRADLLTPDAMRRFEHEAQILGRLQHPGIACIHEAGFFQSPSGPRPFFAMEFIRGESLGDYVAGHVLDTRARLALFERICDAVDHAHQAGVVHRDLKPSNILVDAAGNPRIVDFGVAKLVDGADAARSMHTAAGQLVGTMAYMSPEQVASDGTKVDARSDVYSLGVILFELLADRLPHDIRGRGLPEIARMIREDEPTHLSSISSMYRGDLDTITAKALEKVPSRRYASAGALAADIHRFLHDEPVEARPASTVYQLGKFARRHRELVAGVAAAFILLLAGLVGVSWFAYRESTQRRLAEANEARARRESYRNCIAAADQSLQLHDVVTALRTLESAPESLRGWEWRYLRRACDQSEFTLQASDGPIDAVVGAASGRVIITGDAKGRIGRWDARSGNAIGSEDAHAGGVHVLSLSPDGRHLLSAGADSSVAMWDTDSGAPKWRRSIVGSMHDQPFLKGGTEVAVPMGGRVAFLDVATGEERSSIALSMTEGQLPTVDASGTKMLCHLGPVMACIEVPTGVELWRSFANRGTFSADGARAWLHSEWARTISMHNSATGQIEASVNEVQWLLAGGAAPWLAMLAGNGTPVLCDAQSGQVVHALLGHTAQVRAISRSAADAPLFTAAADGTIKVWDVESTGARFVIAPSNDATHAAALTPDGDHSVTVGWTGVKLWDVRSGEELWTSFPIRNELHAVAIDPEGRRIAVAGYAGQVAVLRKEDGSVIATSERISAEIRRVAWSHDSGHVLAASGDGRLLVIDAATGATVRALSLGSLTLEGLTTGRVSDLTAVGGNDGRLRLGNLRRFAAADEAGPAAGEFEILEERATADPVTSLALSPDESLLVSGTYGGTVTLWDAKNGLRLWTTHRGGAGAVTELVFLPDASRIVAGHSQSAVRVMDVVTGDMLLELRVPNGWCRGIGFSGDGDRLLSVSAISRVGQTVFEAGPAAEYREARRFQRSVRRVTDQAFARLGFSEDVEQELRTDASIAPEIREAAIRLTRARGDHPNYLNGEAWNVVRFPNASKSEYEIALRKAEVAHRLRPTEHGILNTLGVAQYRVGHHAEAITTLRRALAISDGVGPASPIDLLVLAMALAAAGETAQAQAEMVRAREALEHESFKNDKECQWFAAEAEAFVPR